MKDQQEEPAKKNTPAFSLGKVSPPVKPEATMESRMHLLEKRLEEQMKILNKVVFRMEEMHRYIIMRRIWGFLKFVLFIGPLILAIMYLPPLLNNALAPYKELLGYGTIEENTSKKIQSSNVDLNKMDVGDILKLLKE